MLLRPAIAVFACVFVAAPLAVPPTGVYRTAVQFRQQKPGVSGTEVRLSEKRGGFIVMRESGPAKIKTIVPADSVWGYVDGKGHAFRYYRGTDYRIEQTDTLVVYSRTSPPAGGGPAAGNTGMVTPGAKYYFFSRGLTGIPFPLTTKTIRMAYESSNPAFVAAAQAISFTQSLSDYDTKTESFRVVQLYRENQGK